MPSDAPVITTTWSVKAIIFSVGRVRAVGG
jgi:hypothetical protein